MTKLPPRTLDTMSMAISMSSPNGRISKRAAEDATERLRVALFGERGLHWCENTPSDHIKKESLLKRAKVLRDLAACGMRPKKHTKEAEKLEAEAEDIL